MGAGKITEPRGRRRAVAVGAMLAAVIASGTLQASAQTAAADPTSRLQNRPDGALVRDVRTALRRMPALEAAGIRVRARLGVVTLTGWVPAREQIARAGNAARSVHGVRSVSNELVVRNTR